MNGLTYKFEGLSILRGYDVLASGEADVEYSAARALSDAGRSYLYVGQINVTSITVNSISKGGAPLNLSQDHWLYKLILEALDNDADLLEACEIDAEEEF
jgi:hypothetical protein